MENAQTLPLPGEGKLLVTSERVVFLILQPTHARTHAHTHTVSSRGISRGCSVVVGRRARNTEYR